VHQGQRGLGLGRPLPDAESGAMCWHSPVNPRKESSSKGRGRAPPTSPKAAAAAVAVAVVSLRAARQAPRGRAFFGLPLLRVEGIDGAIEVLLRSCEWPREQLGESAVRIMRGDTVEEASVPSIDVDLVTFFRCGG
jgi:hypothetical protein